MGKTKGFNWRARKVVDVAIDDTKTNKIQIEISGADKDNYDKCNILALPSKKRKTKIKENAPTTTKILSKSKRKQLEKIVERKKKKQNRSTLLEALAKVQVSDSELKQLTSISAMQTKGLKKFDLELKSETLQSGKNHVPTPVKISSTKGSLKRPQEDNSYQGKKIRIDDPNVVGFDSDTEVSDLSDDEETTDSKQPTEIPSEHDDGDENQQCDEKEIENNPPNDETVANDTLNLPTTVDDLQTTEESSNLNGKTVEKSQPLRGEVAAERKPATFVHVERNPEIQAARLKLPILAEEQVIMETINQNQIIILAGETGSGKTTQIPQFLYEAGYATEKMIGITEPRRVAAISMSKRVAEEMSLTSKEVSYLIRFEGNATDETKIKFMTDGVLLKEVHADFLLKKYSIIILDEAHERSVYTDILIGLLSRIVPLRCKRYSPLKLIIMSATLRLEDFTENSRLFKLTPPVIKVEARQFPVTVHFNKRTGDDYLREAFQKVAKIHNQLPSGGILIFVTGQREVNLLVRKLRRVFPLKQQHKILQKPVPADNDVSNDSEVDFYLDKSLKRQKRKEKNTLPNINLDDYCLPDGNEDVVSLNGSDIEEDEEDNEFESTSFTGNNQPLWTLPLYSLLPSYKQAKVFDPPPNGCRMCVVCTNVAETSLTIPNIKYVVDTGRTKVRLYDKTTGVSMHQVTWVSKAAANQRAGRAGRTGPGHCYRLYSSAVFNDVFKEFAIPEIQQKPVDDLYLLMKCMNIDKITNFPFPSAPDLLQLRTAEQRLLQLGALQTVDKITSVTPLGQAISKFPVLPRYGKMLALSHQQGLLPYTICLVAALSVPEVLLETPISNTNLDLKQVWQKWVQIRRSWAGSGQSFLLGDPMVLLRAVGAAEFANSTGSLERFCTENGLRHKAVIEIRKLRIQLTNEIQANMPELDLTVDPKMMPPNETQARLLRQVMLSGMGDQVAKKVDLDEIKDDIDKAKFKHAYQCPAMEEPVFLHSSSILRKQSPEWVIYQEIYETNKMYMRGVTSIEPEWLPVYVSKLCNIGEPLTDPPPRYDAASGKIYCTVSGSFGQQSWQLPNVELPFPDNIHKYKWFARFLLEGRIFKKLEKYSKCLLSTPSTMVKTWANLQPRTDILLKTLMSQQIDSRDKLIVAWQKNSNYLLSAYQTWIPESAHNEVTLLWPPID